MKQWSFVVVPQKGGGFTSSWVGWTLCTDQSLTARPALLVYRQGLRTHTHILAHMVLFVAFGYQAIKEWGYNGGRPQKEKNKRDYRRKETNVCSKGGGPLCMNWLVSSSYNTRPPPFFPPPGPGHYPRVGGRNSSRRLHSVTKAAISIKPLISDGLCSR